ncbi:MAG: NTP transferase domain-containing protein, partial [Terriglobales bacterium]
MPGTSKIVPVILAAGPSSLGFPTALARFGESTALDIALRNCVGLGPPIVVLGCEAKRIREHVPTGIKVVVNPDWRSGQMSSLRSALAQ